MKATERSSVDPLAPHSSSARELKALLATKRSGLPFLAFRDVDGELNLPTLAAGPVTIGRGSGADVVVSWDTEVSGVHAELQVIGGEWMIVDDGLSKNGTFVNGKRIAARQRLRDGDRIRVGRTLIVLNAPGSAALPITSAAGDMITVEQLSPSQHRVLIALCRPLNDASNSAMPATNQQIAQELFLSVAAVKATLRALYERFELSELPQNEKRARLAQSALELGLVALRDR